MTSTLEARTAAATMARLSNATALHQATNEIPVIFELEPTQTLLGFDDVQHAGFAPPSAVMLDTDIGLYSVAKGHTLEINDVVYKIRLAKPDGMGLTEFTLEAP